MEKIKIDKGYKNLLGELKSIIDKGKYQAYKKVDNIKVQTYWQLGERIVREEMNNQERADYGKYLIDNLAIDLEVEKKLMYKIVRFYRVYPIVAALRGQLGWKHYSALTPLTFRNERVFYESKTIANSWSYRELERQIKNNLYQNTND